MLIDKQWMYRRMSFLVCTPGLMAFHYPGQRGTLRVTSVMESLLLRWWLTIVLDWWTSIIIVQQMVWRKKSTTGTLSIIAKYRPNSLKVQEPFRDEVSDEFNSGFRCRYRSRKSPQRLSTPCRQFPQETSPCVSPRKSMQDSSTEKLLEESPRESQKDSQICELRETVELLEAKVAKLEQLVRLKDHKIHVLNGKPARQVTGK